MLTAAFRFASVFAVPFGLAHLMTSVTTEATNPAGEARSISGIRSVVLRTGGTLIIEQGTPESFAIEAVSAVASRVTTTVSGSRLTIDDSSSRSSDSITYRLIVKDLSAVELEGEGRIEVDGLATSHLKLVSRGAGDIWIDHLTSDDLRVATYGAGSIRLTGTATRQDVELFGAGAYLADQLASRDTTVSLRGSGLVSVQASDELDVRIWGSGAVEYTGNPHLHQGGAGIGRVTRRG
jgi:hypothetical protein